MRTNSQARFLSLFLALTMIIGGCQMSARSSRKASSKKATSLTMTDPCTMRLHDLSGALLLYHANHGRLPDTLEALREMPGVLAPLESFECPASHQPYQYDPNGEKKGERLLLLYDSAPAHEGMRWAVEMVDWKPGRPLVTRIEQLPEKVFSGVR